MILIEIDAQLWTILSGIGGLATVFALVITIAQMKISDDSQPMPRKKLWIALGAMAALVLLLVLLWLKSHPEDNSKMQQVQASLEQIQMQQVAQSQPQPQQPAQQMDGEEAERKEDEAYRKCTTISDCDSYLRTYPHGRYEDKVRQKRSELVEDEAYKKCTTISDCQEYLVKYPDGRYASEVRRKLEQLEQKQAKQQSQKQPQTQTQSQTQQQTQKQPQTQSQTQQQTIQNTPTGGTSTTGIANGHEYVNLGLPSGTLWATCNVGASKPEGYGNYYAWGETQSKTNYNWSTHIYCNGDCKKLTKYCDKSDYGNNGFTDNLTELQSGDDPATANWGSGWETPNKVQWEELLSNTTDLWTTRNGVKGRLFTSKKNNQTLFLPAAGCRLDTELYKVGYGYYWTRSFGRYYPSYAQALYFPPGDCYIYDANRCFGYAVRPVRQK